MAPIRMCWLAAPCQTWRISSNSSWTKEKRVRQRRQQICHPSALTTLTQEVKAFYCQAGNEMARDESHIQARVTSEGQLLLNLMEKTRAGISQDVSVSAVTNREQSCLVQQGGVGGGRMGFW